MRNDFKNYEEVFGSIENIIGNSIEATITNESCFNIVINRGNNGLIITYEDDDSEQLIVSYHHGHYDVTVIFEDEDGARSCRSAHMATEKVDCNDIGDPNECSGLLKDLESYFHHR